MVDCTSFVIYYLLRYGTVIVHITSCLGIPTLILLNRMNLNSDPELRIKLSDLFKNPIIHRRVSNFDVINKH